MSNKNIQVTLASRPVGWAKETDFKIVETDIPKPGAGQVLVRNLYLSLDPYMRGRMNDVQSYAPNVKIGQVMVGGTAGEVVESNNPKFKAGDSVVGYFGWQQYGVSDGAGLQKVDPKLVPLSAYLGAVGMPGLTAWLGMIDIGAPKPGETWSSQQLQEPSAASRDKSRRSKDAARLESRAANRSASWW